MMFQGLLKVVKFPRCHSTEMEINSRHVINLTNVFITSSKGDA